MEWFIGVVWPLTVTAALYAGYRFGARWKRQAAGGLQQAADAAKRKIGEV